ncbi:hypothetical protein ABZ769_27940 [Streptomyces olivoreticuli]
MDAGLAGMLGGVIGAAVGGFFTTAAAYVTGHKAERQARLQVEAQHEQQRQQHRVEHLRERREPRAQAYTNLLTGIEELKIILQGAFADGRNDPEHVRDTHHLAKAKLRDIRPLEARVRIEGPELMMIPVHKLMTAVDLVMFALEEHPEDIAAFAGLREKIPAAEGHFISMAGHALEDEGEELYREGGHPDPWPARRARRTATW